MNEKILNRIFNELVNVSKNRGTITYNILAKRSGLDSYANWRFLIWEYLDEINRREVEEGRPMITAVAVREDSGIPGDGFWDCAYYTCKVWDGNGSKEKFWRNELDRVWHYWGNK